MNATQRAGLLQRWSVVQEERIDFVPAWAGVGRPPQDRGALANGFVAKAVLGLTTTVALIDRLDAWAGKAIARDRRDA